MMILGLFIFQTLLILTTKINIYPELFYFPWLVAQGQIPYIDFFDHHGFLLYYLLAPFSLDTSLGLLKVVYYIVQTTYLLVTYRVLKEHMHGLALFAGTLLFILLNFFFTGGNMWYESFIGLGYISIFAYIQLSKRTNPIVLGLIIALVSMIKPTSGIILLPVLFYKRDIRIAFYSGLFWIPVILTYAFKGGLFRLIDNLILFNSFYARYMTAEHPFFMDSQLLIKLGLFLAIGIFYSLFIRKVQLIRFSLLFLLAALTHVLPRFEYTNLVPATPFFALVMAYPLEEAQKIMKNIYVVVLVILLICLARNILRVYPWMRERTVYMQHQHSCKLYTKKDASPKTAFYIFSNNPEVYYTAHFKIKLYHPLIFPWYRAYYPHLEDRAILDIEKADPYFLLIPQPEDPRFVDLARLKSYLNESYQIQKQAIPCNVRLEHML
jgi:hypothetical protein